MQRVSIRTLALMLDLLLQHLWEVGRATAPPAEAKATSAMALVAIGGYGRGELNPNSDIDFMFLHDCGSSRSSMACSASGPRAACISRQRDRISAGMSGIVEMPSSNARK